MSEALNQFFQKLLGRFGNDGSRREDSFSAGLHERVVILRRYDTSANDHNVVATLLFEFVFQFWHECRVSSGEGGHSENMDVVFHRLPGRFGRRSEQWPNVDVETEVGKRRRDHFLAAVMSVLAVFGNQ